MDVAERDDCDFSSSSDDIERGSEVGDEYFFEDLEFAA